MQGISQQDKPSGCRGRLGVNGLGVVAVLCAMLVGGGAVRGDDLGDAWKLYLTGDVTGCLALAEAAVAGDEYDEDWHWLQAQSLVTLGQYGEALSAVTNSLQRLPRSIRLRWLARDVYRQNGQTLEGPVLIAEIFNLVERRPWTYRSVQDRVVVGRAALLRGADPRLVLDRLYQRAKTLDAKVREAYLAIGELALEKRDFELAAKELREGLAVLPEDPDLHYGLARAFAPSDRGKMLESLRAALELNPKHVPSLLLMAEHQIAREDYDAAEELLGRVRSVNPYHPEAWAYRAVVAHLRHEPAKEAVARQMALRFWPTNPQVPHWIGRKLSEKYRFAEGATLQRQALEFDPEFGPARLQLAQDLLRLGEEEEGWRLAESVHDADGYDVAALNLVTLRDVLRDYRLVTNEHFRVRLEAHEAEVYGERALRLLEQARAVLVDKYGMELRSPVAVEVFAEQKDFAVRTFGMPENHGYLGVCFGSVITANSPASRPGTRFNWESMLWHEFCHVVTLQMTRNKMPRWLSEGISVYEERQARPSWGERWTPVYRARVLEGRMTPVSKLSGAFLSVETPEDLQFAYFQSSLVVGFLSERYGLEAVRQVLRALGEGEWINDALESHVGSLEELEAGFEAYAREQAEAFGRGLDWEKPPLEVLVAGLGREAEPRSEGENEGVSRSPNRRLDLVQSGRGREAWDTWAEGRTNNVWVLMRQAGDLASEQRWDAALPLLEDLIGRCPEFLDGDGPWPMLLAGYRATEQTEKERRLLEAWAARDDDAVDVYARLMAAAAGEEDWPVVVENAERYLAVDPLVPLPYRRLAEAAEALGLAQKAADAYRVLLTMDPPNPAEVHYRLARVLYRAGDAGARRYLLESLQDAPGNRAGLELLLEMEKD